MFRVRDPFSLSWIGGVGITKGYCDGLQTEQFHLAICVVWVYRNQIQLAKGSAVVGPHLQALGNVEATGPADVMSSGSYSSGYKHESVHAVVTQQINKSTNRT